MPSQDVEALVELARHCCNARASLPETGFNRLSVLLDMILVELAREGFSAEVEAEPEMVAEAETPLP